jgi:hypothetical protein
MRRPRATASFEEPSLVPLADMLSNTVGVMVFIFIFTVITAGGASVPKRLPMERRSQLPFVLFLCRGERIYALDAQPAVDRFLAPLGRASLDTVDAWVDSFNHRRVQADSFELAGEGTVERRNLGLQQAVSIDVAVIASPVEDRGGTAADLRRPGSGLRAFLGRYPPSGHFVFFVVYPDALRVFRAARGAVVDAGYSTGWSPQTAGEPLRFGFGKGGRSPGWQ